jgi:hypothetical protein
MAAKTKTPRTTVAAADSLAVGKSPRAKAASERGNAVTRMTDNKGRVGLGGSFANRAVIVQKLSETEMIVKLARVIPESESWLYDNTDALAAVRAGLVQARAGKVTKGPNLDADAKFVDQLEAQAT